MPYRVQCKLVAWVRAPRPRRWWETAAHYERYLVRYQINARERVLEAQSQEERGECPIPAVIPYGVRFDLTPGFDAQDTGTYENHDAAQHLVDSTLNPKADSIWNRGTIGDNGAACSKGIGSYQPHFFVIPVDLCGKS